MAEKTGFLAELKRRHVWRVVIAYIVAAWLLVQVATQLFPFFGIPGWSVRLLVLVLVLVFPVVVVLTWAFEITPEGVRRTAAAASPDARPEPQHRDVARKLDVVIVVLLVLAIGMTGWRIFAPRQAWPAAQAPPVVARTAAPSPAAAQTAAAAPEGGVQSVSAKSIAVLPFENLSSDKANAYFADGMQDLILSKLADIGDLKVISRTSTMQYKSHPGSLKKVAAELGVATILEGSVQKAGNQVLITVQLIDARSDTHLWAHNYQRTLDNIFGVEGEVAGQIAGALHAKLSPAHTARLATAPTSDKAAYDLFLRADYQANLGDVNGSITSREAAIALYRQATGQDPKFALAWARLSTVESRVAFSANGNVDVAQLNRRARADAERAIALQPDLPAAQLALGYSAYWGHRDYAAALKAFGAVLAIRPNDAAALAARGYVESRQGRFDAAIASLTQAVALDPRNFTLTYSLAGLYMSVSRYADAESWYQRALSLEPDSLYANFSYSQAIVFGRGDVARALAVAQRGKSNRLTRWRVRLLTYQHRFREAIALYATIPDTPDNFPVAAAPRAWWMAVLYWQAGDREHARALFSQALPQSRAALDKARGIGQAEVLNYIGSAEIGSGHIAAGLAAIARGEAILDRSNDAVGVPDIHFGNAFAYSLMAHRADLAVPLLAKVLARPGFGASYSPTMLWIDPIWDPIRTDPGFQALLKKYAKYKPAVTYPASPHQGIPE